MFAEPYHCQVVWVAGVAKVTKVSHINALC